MHVRTDRPTDRSLESLTTIGRCTTRATRPNNTHTLSALIGQFLYAASPCRMRDMLKSYPWETFGGFLDQNTETLAHN